MQEGDLEPTPVDRWSKAPEGAAITPGYKSLDELDRTGPKADRMARGSIYAGLFALVVFIAVFFSPLGGVLYSLGLWVSLSAVLIQLASAIFAMALATRSWRCPSRPYALAGVSLSIVSLLGGLVLLARIALRGAFL